MTEIVTPKNPVKGMQLKRARELLSLSLEEVANELSLTTHEVKLWEDGVANPNLNQLESLARLYGREIDYFLKTTSAPPSGIKFRGKPDQTVEKIPKEARSLLSKPDELCLVAHELENLLNKKHEIRIPRFDEQTPAIDAAKQIRKLLGVGEKPLPNLREKLEELGLRIFELPVPGDAFSGFSYYHDVYGPCILINARDVKGRRNFTLAHELAHLVYGQGSSVCFILGEIDQNTSNVESKANLFAIELLLPFPAIENDYRRKNLSKSPSGQELAIFGYKWGVSKQALGYRLESLSLIEKGYTDTLLDIKPKFRTPKGKKEPWKKQLGKKLVADAVTSYKRGLISISKLSHILQVPIRKAMEIGEQ